MGQGRVARGKPAAGQRLGEVAGRAAAAGVQVLAPAQVACGAAAAALTCCVLHYEVIANVLHARAHGGVPHSAALPRDAASGAKGRTGANAKNAARSELLLAPGAAGLAERVPRV